MSYRVGQEIMSNKNRWELDDGSSKHVIYLDYDNNYRVATLKPDGDKWYVESALDNSLWFNSYSSARLYMKNECYVEGKFSKVKSQ